MKTARILSAAALGLAGLLSLDAAAATIRVTCEVRPNRSKISVDGKSLPRGTYTAQAVSGGNMATSAPEAAVGGEVETDFASNPADIADGAVAIPSTFIVDGTVTGKIVDAGGNTVISDTVACRVRRK